MHVQEPRQASVHQSKYNILNIEDLFNYLDLLTMNHIHTGSLQGYRPLAQGSGTFLTQRAMKAKYLEIYFSESHIIYYYILPTTALNRT